MLANESLRQACLTLTTSQLPIKAWHTYLKDSTLADAILDRIVRSSHKIELKTTKSMRDTAEGGASNGLAET
jgi:DNA replication protein DnaC